MPQDTASYLLPPRRLPITDRKALRAALADADVPAMLMVLTHLQRDEAFAQRFAPYLGSPYNHRLPPPPAELVQELRERLFAVLTQDAPPGNAPLPRELMRKMMSINVGEPVTDEFIPLLIEQMGFDKESPRLKDPQRQAPPADYKVLVIGAGLTGLLAGIKLEEAGYGYRIFEKNPEIGGTWFENVYPGVGVDTPSHFYCYSFEPNPDWTYFHPRGAEMQAYLLRIADKYRLRRNIVFNTAVKACVYDETRKKWRVTVRDEAGERVVEADAIINAQGPLNRWSMPNIPGLGEFKGIVMHTARWHRDIDLTGKRVALIGTGASGAQVGPAIVDQVAHLSVFQRSKHWVMPNPVFDQKVPEGVKWALRHIPHYAEWFRFRIYWFSSDGLFKNVQIDPEWPHQDRSISAHNEAIRQYCVGYLHKQCEGRPDLLEKLTPDFPVFSKRIVLDPNWIGIMKRDNVTLETTPIERVNADAIVMRDGRSVPADVIICATGFEIARMLGHLKVIGREGRSLNEEWGEENPRAYMGVTIPGYPNFFMTTGPNSAPNHAAGQNLISETQINYAIECLDFMLAHNGRAIEPTQQAFDDFNAKVDQALKGLVWSHPKARSYYRNSKGRVFLSNPYRLVDYWKMTRRPEPGDYHIE